MEALSRKLYTKNSSSSVRWGRTTQNYQSSQRWGGFKKRNNCFTWCEAPSRCLRNVSPWLRQPGKDEVPRRERHAPNMARPYRPLLAASADTPVRAEMINRGLFLPDVRRWHFLAGRGALRHRGGPPRCGFVNPKDGPDVNKYTSVARKFEGLDMCLLYMLDIISAVDSLVQKDRSTPFIRYWPNCWGCNVVSWNFPLIPKK